jgi:hypothetical protein
MGWAVAGRTGSVMAKPAPSGPAGRSKVPADVRRAPSDAPCWHPCVRGRPCRAAYCGSPSECEMGWAVARQDRLGHGEAGALRTGRTVPADVRRAPSDAPCWHPCVRGRPYRAASCGSPSEPLMRTLAEWRS